MQGFTKKQKLQTGFKINDLSLEDRNKLVGAFAWLVEQDKKQNPALYQRNNSKKYD